MRLNPKFRPRGIEITLPQAVALVPAGFLAISVFPPYIRARTYDAISVIFLEEDEAELRAPTTPRPTTKKNPLSKLKQLFFPKPLLNNKNKRRPRKPPIGRPRRKPPNPSIQRPGQARPRQPASSLMPPPARRRRRHATSGLWPRPPRRRRFPFSSFLEGARNVFYRFQSRCRRLRRQIAWYAGLKV